MNNLKEFSKFTTCDYADCLPSTSIMDRGIKPLWSGGSRLVGMAFTVKCVPGDNLMAHAAIYQAPAGSVLVIDTSDSDFAVAGGNVCATAAERGILGFIVDGVVRDVAEIRDIQFPVYSRGNVPKPGEKAKLGEMSTPITCGGITVRTGDIVIADEEGIVIIEANIAEQILEETQKRVAKEQNQSLAEWQSKHYEKVSTLLTELKKESKEK